MNIVLSFLLCICAAAASASTTSPEVSRGLVWLQAQLTADGSVAGESQSIANVEQARGEVATTLSLLGSTPPQKLLGLIASSSPRATELLARKAIALNAAGESADAVLVLLAASQNADGGFGGEPGFASNPADTAWALLAWADKQTGYEAGIKAAVQWLATAQAGSGAWLSSSDGQDTYPASLAIQALSAYRGQFTLSANLSKGRSWLAAQRNGNGSWETDAHTAAALLALLPAVTDASPFRTSVDYLISRQETDASWGGDAFTTSIVLQALTLAAQPVTNPDLASITGVVKDASSGNPITGATVQLTKRHLSAQTDASGSFAFSRLHAGDDQLKIDATGYRGLTSDIDLNAGNELALGTIRLSVSASSGVTVTGVATYVNSEDVQSAAVNVSVSVGGKSARTDNTGVYRIEGLQPGEMSMVAKYSYGYMDYVANFSAADGTTVSINPVFRPAGNVAGTGIDVLLTDADTGLPVSGCYVMINAGPIYGSDANGLVRLSKAQVNVGSNVVSTYRCSNYAQSYIELTVRPGQVVVVPLVLKKKTNTSGMMLEGQVLDTLTHLPISGANVAIAGLGVSGTTDANGKYSIQSPSAATSFVVDINAVGYLGISQRIQYAGVHNVLNASLWQSSESLDGLSISITAKDRMTGAPLPGAIVDITGANVAHLSTDANGRASRSGLGAGATSVQVSFSGYESLATTVDLRPGIAYQLPVELLPVQGSLVSIRGAVLDAESQQAIPGVSVSLAGAATNTVVTDVEGNYEFSGLVPGSYTLSAAKSGYQTTLQSVILDKSLAANIPFVRTTAAASTWDVFGTLVDADTFEPVSGANVVLEEVIAGQSVYSTQQSATAADGGFNFKGLREPNARLLFDAPGYDTTIETAVYGSQSWLNLGVVKIRKAYNAALPDLTLSDLDRSALVVQPDSFTANGVVSARAINNSSYAAGGFDMVLFIDDNHNQVWDEGVDTVVGQTRLANGLAPGESQMISFEVKDLVLPFRDAPLYVMIDSRREVVENIEGNNTQVIVARCSASGALQDVSICVDSSGSVSSLISMELQGVTKAVENPNIIPHDGSIRLTITTAQSGVEAPRFGATIITSDSAAKLVSDLKKWTGLSGSSTLANCAYTLSKYMDGVVPRSSNRGVILVGDGYWEGGGAATGAWLSKSVASHVNKIDAIGVGVVRMSELRDNVWPQPANSPGGGKVVIAKSTGEIAAAMATSLGNAVRLTDLSVGGLRVEDNGVGHPVSFTARVGNGGGASQATKLRFYQGARLLGEMPVAILAMGEYVDIRLENVTLSGTEDVRAVVDEDKANSECNLSNNTHSIPLLASLPVAQIVVSTDQPSYATGASVSLHSASTNAGAVPARLKATLKVEDASGAEVVSFGEKDLGVVAAGAAVSYDEVWSSAGFRAGAYALVGTLTASDGSVVAQSRAAFSVSASAGATIRPVTDKASYGAGEWVSINAVVTNPAFNASLLSTRVALKVIDPKGGVAYTVTRALSELGAMSTREIAVPRALMGAAVGSYVVEAVLSDAQGVELARGATRFAVTTDVSTGLSGAVALAHEVIMRGAIQLRGDTIHNRSGVAISALRVARAILRQSDGKEVHRVESSLAFAAGETKTLPQLSIESLSLDPEEYIAVLQVAQTAQIQSGRKAIQASASGWQVLSAANFSVMAGSGAGSSLQPVPTLNEWALGLLVLLILASGLAPRTARR